MKQLLSLPVFPNEDDLKHGIVGNCHECPIARAIDRALAGAKVCHVNDDDNPEFCYAAVGSERINIRAGFKPNYYSNSDFIVISAPTPIEIQRFIVDFDDHRRTGKMPPVPAPFVLVFWRVYESIGITL